MRRDVDVGLPRRLRLWFGELPNACGAPVEILVRSAENVGGPKTGWSEGPLKAAVEVFIPSGPKSNFALVGGVYTPGDTTLSVRLSVSPTEGPVFVDTINMDSGTTRIGLPSEYSEGVFDAALSCGIWGHMEIDHAAHCEIGSSIVAFRIATRLLCHLFSESLVMDDRDLARTMTKTIALGIEGS